MVYRLHVRPVGVQAAVAVAYCLTEQVVGVGWYIGADVADEDLAAYLTRHRQAGLNDGGIVRRLLNLQEDDLIWFRDEVGNYKLARVNGQPHPRFTEAAQAADMCHVCPAEIVGMISDNDVPGAVKASFSRRGKTLERVGDPTGFVDAYSRHAFNMRAERLQFNVILPQANLFSLLDPYELEDLVLLYLQWSGWLVVLSSHVRNTPRYEASLVREGEALPAGVQVKGMGKSLSALSYADDGRRVFLFAANGDYGEYRPKNVTIIQQAELLEFVAGHPDLLPEPIRLWSQFS